MQLLGISHSKLTLRATWNLKIWSPLCLSGVVIRGILGHGTHLLWRHGSQSLLFHYLTLKIACIHVLHTNPSSFHHILLCIDIKPTALNVLSSDLLTRHLLIQSSLINLLIILLFYRLA
jgi:hypothetical protein